MSCCGSRWSTSIRGCRFTRASSVEHIIGIVHYKDLVRAWQERKHAADRRIPARPFLLRRYLRDVPVVPETKPLNQLVDEFRKKHAHLAMVVDEFGTITGLVTLEDVLEQIFGEIGDEHDVRRPMPVAGAPVIEVDGSTNIRDLAAQYAIELPGDAGFETLAGFLLFRLGYIPGPGESVTYGTRTFIVEEMDRNRIARVKINSRGATVGSVMRPYARLWSVTEASISFTERRVPGCLLSGTSSARGGSSTNLRSVIRGWGISSSAAFTTESSETIRCRVSISRGPLAMVRLRPIARSIFCNRASSWRGNRSVSHSMT